MRTSKFGVISHFAFRISHFNYSASAFEEGLRHVIRRQIEFEDTAYWEISDASKGRRSLQNLYEMRASDGKMVEEKIEEAVNRTTSEGDTHPSPIERFRYARRIVSSSRMATDGMVWDLFENREKLISEMSALIDRQVRAVSGICPRKDGVFLLRPRCIGSRLR
jgi:hypothetical protein